MTNGVDPGTKSLRHAPRWALLVYPAFLVVGSCVAVVNALTVVSDNPGRYGGRGFLPPLVVELTSVAALMLLLPVVWRLVVFAPPQACGWRRFLLVHGPATIPFSAAHIALFDLFRWLLAKVLPLPVCCVAPVEFFYEYRKDLITYGALVLLLGGARMLAMTRERELAAARVAPPPAPQPIAIRDGARTLRVASDELIAVRAAGNYVEHLFADGRVVLERATLAEAQARLEPHGFLRTHRSWLVNPAAVKAIAREGSGDRMLTLTGGVSAPVSRRYAEALAALER